MNNEEARQAIAVNTDENVDEEYGYEWVNILAKTKILNGGKYRSDKRTDKYHKLAC